MPYGDVAFPSAVFEVSADQAAEFNRRVVEEFRANNGSVGGALEGIDLLLLTTVGARSEEERTVPLGYVRAGEQLLVVASNGGKAHHPDWYRNLLVHPMARVEIGTDDYWAVAIPAEADERDRLFTHALREQPEYRDHQARTTRPWPVVRLERSYTEAGRDEVATLADKLLEIHTWLRGQLRYVRVEADAYFTARAAHEGPGDPPGPGLGLQLRQHCLAFCESLEFHHGGEDAYMFPELERRHPHLRETFARLYEEHRTVAAILEELQRLLADVSTADAHRFHSELQRMSTELQAHLAYEEENLIPIMAEIPLPPAPGTT